ncbi:LysM peptidoglycan-binding domain-containing protein [Anaerobacillus alkaliphilus]|uniref:LysM peptidoglycan-binding domain-containing protein n=1 Tax=Anaerobacillus alkaliphilus TaxID=1548597 RepID=A0A4Q0VR31_9BACI|nr:NlpC/P60 family protein [Anaerobacillus alkaliphilus]RXI97830.1 LysM peptidoglycan-binding domain-containing protein [Anaerobacillus alkaliphilus]
MLKISRLLLLLIITLSITATPVTAFYENVPEAGIAINGKMVDGIKPIRINGKYYIPFTTVSKILGYNFIQFERNTSTFEVTDGSTVVRMTMGGSRARRGDEYMNIDPARWVNNTAYVSLDAASSLFNSFIYFKQENGSIQVEKPASRYRVQAGDTLWLIAQAHHTTVQRLMAANGLTSSQIFVGQVLRLPPREHTKEMEPIKEKRPVERAPQGSTTIQTEVINVARTAIGAGYKFGATLAEAPRLFDCSSYTQWAFGQRGVTIPRTSREQAGIGVSVATNSLRQGDLLFFQSPTLYSDGRVGHVGIYMDGGHMIHASSSNGVHITYNVLNNSYWGRNYLFAKRIIQ